MFNYCMPEKKNLKKQREWEMASFSQLLSAPAVTQLACQNCRISGECIEIMTDLNVLIGGRHWKMFQHFFFFFQNFVDTLLAIATICNIGIYIIRAVKSSNPDLGVKEPVVLVVNH